jgi:hypothetical protein
MTYSFHYGLKSHQAAVDAMHDAIAAGELSMGERPQIHTYYATTSDGRQVQRWQIVATV